MILTENARLRLRTMCRDDLEELYALLSDAEVMRWLEPFQLETPRMNMLTSLLPG